MPTALSAANRRCGSPSTTRSGSRCVGPADRKEVLMTEDVESPGSAGSDDPSRHGRKVLVISTVARSPAVLREVVGGEIDELWVVVPVVHQSRLQWLTNADDEARERAEGEAAELGRALPSKETESTAGESDPLLAVEDALREFAADEVVIVTHPDEEANWLEEGKGREIAETLHGVKVTRLELSD
jgi:hypothetical protein